MVTMESNATSTDKYVLYRDFTLRSTMPHFWNYSIEFLLSQWSLSQFMSHIKNQSHYCSCIHFSFNPPFNKLLLSISYALCAVLTSAEKNLQDTGSVLKSLTIYLLHPLQLNIGVTLGFVVLPPFNSLMSLFLYRKEYCVKWVCATLSI